MRIPNTPFKAKYLGKQITVVSSCSNGYEYKLDKTYLFSDGTSRNWIDILDKNLK